MPVTIDVPGLGPVSIPDEIPSEQADQYVRQIAQKRGVKLELPAPEPVKTDKSYGLGAAAQDIGVSALGLIPGVIETVSAFTPTDRVLRAIGAQQGIAGLLPETEIGKDVGKYGVLAGTAKSLRDLQQELYSKESEVARQEFAKKLAEQEGSPFGEAGVAFKETLTTPELMTTQLPESLLSIIGGRGLVGFGGKVLKAATPQVVKEAGERAVQRAAEKIGEEGVEKIAKISGGPETVKTVLGGAAMQGGSVSNQNFIATMDMPQSKLAATPEYQEAIASGMSPEEARLSVARGAANGALAPATALSIVAQYAIPGGTSFERLFAGATQRTLGKEGALEIAKQIGKATLGEAGSEALEEGGGQFIANVFAPGQEDLTQGVGAAAGAAGALGALMGGGAGGVQALQASRANKIMAERQQQEEEARQELDARMPPVQQIESPEPAQLPLEQIRTEGQGFVSNIPAGSTFTLDDIIGNTGATASPDAIAVANDLLNRGEIVRQPGDTLSFRRVNDDERVIPLGNPDQTYVYTVPTTREGTELNDGYTVESSALGVTRQAANQEEADKIKQAMLDRAGQRAVIVDEQLNNLRAQLEEISRTITEAYTRPDISDAQLQQLQATGEQTTQKLNDEIAKLEEQKATILAEPTITPINPRAETGHEVRLHTPGQPARVLNPFATEQEAYDAIIDNSTPEQDRLIAEDPAYEAVRNRLEERAAELDEAEAEPQEAEPVEMTPEMQGRVTQTANRMRGVLDQMGLRNIGLNVQQKLQEMVNGKLSAVDGYYLNRVISASLEGSRDVTATIGHETIHALRELGMFSDKEWEILTKRAQSEWIEKYGIRERYEGMLAEEKVIEEAIADAFGNWLQGNLKATGVIQGLFNRIKLVLEKVGSVLRGQGFTTSSDIFKRARTGTLEGDRVERVAEGKQYALPQTVNVDGVERPTRISEEARAGAAVSGSDLMEGMGIPEEEQSQYWRNLSQEERDALFEKYYRSVSGAGRVIHPTIEGVKNFWRWFGNSKIVNKDGTPKVMYHGTARDISEFRKQQANAIFVTEDPEFARTFADMSLGWMVKNATQVLDDKTLELAIDAGITEAVLEDAVTNKFAKEWLKDHEGFSLKNILRDVLSSPMSDYVSARIQDELPSKDNIIQLYVRAEKTFDYDSQEDRDALMAWAKSLDKNNPARQFIEDKKNEIEFGEWEVIESPAVQDFIKSSGYDSFYMYETGRKNLAVYDPNQLKSAVGNTGAFSRDSGEIQYALPLTPEETQDIVKRAKGDARLAQILNAAIYLTPEERLKLRSVAGRANAINMVDTLAMFPSAEEYAAIAYAGRAKRGWYENSAKALVSVFGGDAPRFAALLAALSPQCSVQTNLLNALNLWKNWTAAGRPQDRASIMRIAGQSVQGDKGEKSVLDAWKNNSVSALTAKDFTNFKLSGPKVNSFYLNLIGVTNEVTNDAWMSNFANLDQEIFSGSLNKAGTDPGKGPGYLAGNIVVRQAAERLTELTGEKWTPAEVQETVWSWAKALYEGAEAEGLSPIQFLTEGRLTEELINSVPDFSQLFYSDIYASILRSAGYGEQVDGLIQQRNANRAELSDQEQGVAVQTAPFAPVTQKELEKSAAKRLTALEEVRQKESTLNRVFKESPMAIFEARPSESLTQLVPSLRTGDRKLIKKFTNGAKSILFDSDGRDRIAKILGFDIGLPKKKGDETKHRVGSGGFEGKVSANYQVRIPEEFANPYSAATGYVFLQDAVPWQKLDPEGWGFGLAITIPKLNDEIEHEFFSRFEGLTDTGHTRAGNTILVGNFTNYKEIQKATKTQKGIEQANIDDELFKSIVCQIANEIAVKHGVRVRVAGYRFNGNLLENNIEDENGKEVNAWATTGTGAGYLRGDVAERLAPVQDQLDDLQSEFLDYCRAFQEEQDRKGKRKVKGGEQFALPQNILGQPARLPTWTYPTDSKYDNVIYYLMDKMIDLKRVIEGIAKSGTKILDQWNPYLKEELYHGRTAEQTERFLRTEIRPLLQDLSRNNITIAELEEYLHNRHAEERNIQIASINPNLPDGGSGITTQKANNYLNALPQARRMLLERLARRVDDINKGTRDILVKSGLETPQTIAAWENTYKKYVPLFREDADYVTSSGYGVGEGFSVRGDFAKRAIGSTRGVVDIFANVVTQRERAIIRAEKNRVAQAVYGLAVQNPNKQFWMVIDPEGIKDPNQVRADLMNLGINPNDVANIFQQPTRTQPDPRTGLVTNKLDPFVLKSDNVLTTRIDGKNKYVLFNNNDPSAKRMVTAIKNMDADQLGRVMSTLGMVTRWIASVNTQYNPIFGVVNFTRDIQGALLNLSTTPIADKASDVMSVSNVSGALKGIWSTSRAEKSGGAMPTSQWAKLWQDFKDQGGQTGFRSQFSTSEERAKTLEKEINYINAGKPRKAFTAMIDVLSDYNTAMENAVRLTAYKAALDKGISKEQAASIAKNLTVNFNKKGQVATQMGALYAFFNASMRGSVRLYETLTGPMGQKIIWGGLLLGAMQAMMLAAAGFDEDEPPEFVKDRNLILPLGYFTDKKNYISIPMPLGFNVLPNLSRNMVEWWQSGFKDPAKRIAHITGSMLDTFNPMGNAGWSIQTVAPTALDPFAALFENKDSFGRPIAREDISGLDPTPGYTRTKDVATTLGKGIAQFLNAASGGTKYKPGVISPTGDQIDFLAGQAGGGIYRELAKVEQTITSKATGEELPSYKMPLVGRFYGNADENAAQSQRFYSNLTRLNEHENEIKGRLKNREPLGDYFKEYPEARLIKMANSVEYNIRKLKQRRQLLKERGGNEQAVKNINDNIVRLMKRLNERVESTED